MKMKVGMAVILYSAATSSMSSTSTWHWSCASDQTATSTFEFQDGENLDEDHVFQRLVQFLKNRCDHLARPAPNGIITTLHIDEVRSYYQVAKKSTTTSFSPAAVSYNEFGWNWPQIPRQVTVHLVLEVISVSHSVDHLGCSEHSSAIHYIWWKETPIKISNSIWEKNINLKGLLMTKQKSWDAIILPEVDGVRKWATTLTNNMTIIC